MHKDEDHQLKDASNRRLICVVFVLLLAGDVFFSSKKKVDTFEFSLPEAKERSLKLLILGGSNLMLKMYGQFKGFPDFPYNSALFGLAITS